MTLDAVAGMLLAVSLSAAAAAGLAALRATRTRVLEATPVLTLACTLVIAAFSLVQLVAVPDLLPLLMRDGARVFPAEPWRLITSVLVQDGGWAGAVFNLAGFLVIGAVAERLLGRVQWAVVTGVGLAVTQAVALSWQPIGAGNSILTFGLAGAVCARCLMQRPAAQSTLSAAVATACFVVLLFMRDIHGVAGGTGMAMGLGFTWFARPRGPSAVA